MTAYPVLSIATRTGPGVDLTATPTTPGGVTGDTFPPGTDIFIRFTVGATAATPSIVWPTAADAYGDTKQPYPLGGGANLPASADRIFGPFPAAEFADPSDGQVHLSYNNVTTIKASVYRMPDN